MNLFNAEKSLKHWLKNRVSVTTATVVGFLIMGTVSFGVTIGIDQIQNETVKDSNVTIMDNKEENKFGEVNISKNARVDGIVATENEKFTLENNGKIIVKSIGEGDRGATGISASNTNSFNIENTKEITATTFAGSSYGIYVYNDNNHAINLDSSITNTGNITATAKNGGSAIPIYVKVKTDKNIDITNNGNLISNRAGTPQGRGALGAVLLSSVGSGKLTFTNNGDITVNNGIAIETDGFVKVTNNGTINLYGDSLAVKNNGGDVNISGTIIVKDKDGKDVDVNKLFVGPTKVNHTGITMGKDGKALRNDNSVYLSGGLTSDVINTRGKEKNSVSLGLEETIIGTNSQNPIMLNSLNIVGKTAIEGDGILNIKDTTINFDKDGILTVGRVIDGIENGKVVPVVKSSKLSIDGNNVYKYNNDVAINLFGTSTLDLKNVTFNAGIVEKDVEKFGETVKADSTVNIFGKTSINGELGVSKINVGTTAKANTSDKLILSSNSKFTKATTLTNNATGVTVFEIGKDLENALVNSEANAKVTITGKIDFDISSVTKDEDIDLFGGTTHNLTGAEYKNLTDQVYNTSLNKESGTLSVRYNKKLFGDNEILNNINNNAQIVNGNLSQNVAERKIQLDKIYAQNIYTETVRAFYDTLKSTEKDILSLNHDIKPNEFKSHGKVLHSKNDYTKDGTVGSYDIKAETSGLLASIEYGVTEAMRTGVVFSGSKQKVDAMGGKADADLFYFGVYGNKTYGNYDFTAGLGYQLGKYEAKNNIGNVADEDNYNSKGFNGYVQGKYISKLDNDLSLEPKIKLGYTNLKQDNTKGSYFGVSDAEINTFDTEIGVDIVKSVQLEKSKLNLAFGTSYIKTMGDTDKMFKGHFYGDNTSSNFNVLGAELSENVVKLNLGAEIENENGFFYNGSLTYEFSKNNSKSYGANIGIGYKF